MAETLKVACPKCKTVMQLSADLRGQRVKCQSCAAVIAIPAPKAAPAKAAKSTPELQAEQAPAPVNRPGEGEEWGVIESYQVERTEDKPRCPFCAHDMDEDQTVCLNCGYDLMKRDRHGQRVLQPTLTEDYFLWWLPAFGCILVMGGCIAMIVMMLTATPDFGGTWEWLQRRPDKADHPKWGYVYGCVFFAAIIFFCARYAVKRLILNPTPPEKVKHLHKEHQEDD